MYKSTKKADPFILELVCKECELPFTSARYRKYCTDKCRLIVNKRTSRVRYNEMRKVYLAAMEKIEL